MRSGSSEKLIAAVKWWWPMCKRVAVAAAAAGSRCFGALKYSIGLSKKQSSRHHRSPH